jgi:hypothetical protein
MGMRTPDPVALTTALEQDASEGQAYLVLMSDNIGFTLLHNLQCIDHKIRPKDLISSKIVAFGGNIRPGNATPNIFVFDKDKNNLFMWVHLPPAPLLQTIKNYKPSLCNDQKYACAWGASNKKTDAFVSTWMIPIHMEWAPMFVDGPNFGTAFQCLVDLFNSIEKNQTGPLDASLRDGCPGVLWDGYLVKCRHYTLHTLGAA